MTRSQKYAMSNGTSDATAYVSAAAALVRSKYPDLSAGQVINRLIKSATFAHHKGLKAPDEEYGYGIVRPYSALTMDIPAGPKENPLDHLTAAIPPSTGQGTETDTDAQTSSSALLFIVAGLAAVVVVAAIAVAVIRRRRGAGSRPGSCGGVPPHGTGASRTSRRRATSTTPAHLSTALRTPGGPDSSAAASLRPTPSASGAAVDLGMSSSAAVVVAQGPSASAPSWSWCSWANCPPWARSSL
ncbi:S8 family serine peptidase [Streptomyces chartreusis]|uniref:S8 family serine peptidase n=1 Tax=Streptomyces chartreusis TaxID=1969 RepID=UPI00369B37F1